MTVFIEGEVRGATDWTISKGIKIATPVADLVVERSGINAKLTGGHLDVYKFAMRLWAFEIGRVLADSEFIARLKETVPGFKGTGKAGDFSKLSWEPFVDHYDAFYKISLGREVSILDTFKRFKELLGAKVCSRDGVITPQSLGQHLRKDLAVLYDEVTGRSKYKDRRFPKGMGFLGDGSNGHHNNRRGALSDESRFNRSSD